MSHKPPDNAKVKQYIVGFVLSLITTFAAYLLVVNHVFAGWNLIYAIVGLALTQALIQLIFFLHIGREAEPRWNLLVFDLAALIVVIVVFGSLWIMQNLNYGHNQTMSPQDTETFIVEDEGYKP